jgi:ubiquinone/menaquinone biosynthesis C-methylase UbiE
VKAEPQVYSDAGSETYLDLQAAAGITKHFGGYDATDELHRLCRLAEAHEVLEVGCGVGVGPAYIAKRYGCRVVGVDLSPQMLAWAERRVQREGVADRVTLQQANVLALPFEDNRFDATIAESVLAFVEDKAAAIAEMIRVTRPGGYVGLNESYWGQRPPETSAQAWDSLGAVVLTADDWRALWAAAALAERVIAPRPWSLRREAGDRMRWLGWGEVFRAWGRILKLMTTHRELWRAVRTSLRAQTDTPKEVLRTFGYALFVGRKPGA